MSDVSQHIDLNKPATVQVQEYQGVEYLSIRYMYQLPTGEMAFGKNGINIPIVYGVKAIQGLLDVYNKATGSTLELIGDNAVPDPDFDET